MLKYELKKMRWLILSVRLVSRLTRHISVVGATLHSQKCGQLQGVSCVRISGKAVTLSI